MDSLIGYGSDDDIDSDRCGGQQHSTVGGGQRRRDDDTNYDDVNMDMSEESQGAESEPELPPAEPVSSRHSSTEDRRSSGNVSCSSDGSRSRSRGTRGERSERSERRWRHRDDPPRGRARSDRPDRHDRPDRPDRNDRPERSDRSDRSDRSERSDERSRSDRCDRGRGGYEGGSSRRGLLGDRPDDNKVPALMDLKPFGGEPPPGFDHRKAHDARDAASPRFTDRERRDRERDRDRGERHSRRSEERSGRGSGRQSERRDRSRSRGAAYPPTHSGQERRGSPTSSGEYRPSSYKVNKKLEVMEKMGLQIKTPDGMMATAQQLRAAASEAPAHAGLPSYYNAGALNTNKILDQVQKRKLLWSNKNKSDAEEAAKWSGTRFAQDSDGKQVSKFMRLMGIKEPATVKPETAEKSGDPIKKQEELFQAMQAQYEVARATTHTMRGVGLGFQRGQY